MGTEKLYIRCENENCGRMALYKTFHLHADGSRGKEEYEHYNDQEWSRNGSENSSRWRCPSCGTKADLTRRVS